MNGGREDSPPRDTHSSMIPAVLERESGSPAILPDTNVLYREHRAFVWRSLRHLGVPSSELDDALQEVFLVVHRRRSEFLGNSSVRTWLFGVARMVSLSRRKRASVRREDLLSAMPEGLAGDDPASTLERRRELGAVEKVLSAMPEDQRLVFVLFEVQGMSMQEVAEALSCPLKTAYGRLYRARESFRSGWLAQKENG